MRSRNDDTKILAAIACTVVGFFLVANITAQVSHIHEISLDTETCYRAKAAGLTPSTEGCVFTVPFRQVGVGQAVGFLKLPDGGEMQVSPLAATMTGGRAKWTAEMKAQLIMAFLFWVATFVLLFSAFRDKEP